MLNEKEQMLLDMRNERRAAERDEEQRLLNRWAMNWEIYERLRRVGLAPGWHDTGHLLRFGPEVRVTLEDLPRLRTVFDRVQDSGRYEVEDADRHLVKVFLDLGYGVFERHDWMYFVRPYYVKTLLPDARCRIVPQVEVKHEVICGMN